MSSTFRGLTNACALLLLGSSVALAQAPDTNRPAETVLVRLIADGGWAKVDGSNHGNREFGADLLLSANDKQRYGLRLSSLDIDVAGKHQRYLCTGVMLEMVAWRWFRMEIGSVAFVGRGDLSGTNPAGIASFLGYEKRLGKVNFSLGYDSKYIFAKPAITVTNLGVGLGYHF